MQEVLYKPKIGDTFKFEQGEPVTGVGTIISTGKSYKSSTGYLCVSCLMFFKETKHIMTLHLECDSLSRPKYFMPVVNLN